MAELGSYVKKIRLEKGLSIRKVAESADISHTEVKRIEDGVRKQPSPQVLRSLAAALNTPYEDLMEAAGYIDEAPNAGGVTAAGISGTDDLSPEELAQVNEYIEFLKSKRKGRIVRYITVRFSLTFY